MLLENDLKLDFGNVLLRPKRSTAESRKDVNLWRSMKFRNSEGEFYGVPIMAANMDAEQIGANYGFNSDRCITVHNSNEEAIEA